MQQLPYFGFFVLPSQKRNLTDEDIRRKVFDCLVQWKWIVMVLMQTRVLWDETHYMTLDKKKTENWCNRNWKTLKRFDKIMKVKTATRVSVTCVFFKRLTFDYHDHCISVLCMCANGRAFSLDLVTVPKGRAVTWNPDRETDEGRTGLEQGWGLATGYQESQQLVDEIGHQGWRQFGLWVVRNSLIQLQQPNEDKTAEKKEDWIEIGGKSRQKRQRQNALLLDEKEQNEKIEQ